MVIGFKTQFVQPILDGTKIHTIREDAHNRWQTGKTMHMATGVRTKQYKQFNKAVCTGKQSIAMYYDDAPFPIISIDGQKPIDYDTLLLLAKNDGFKSVEDFIAWFSTSYVGWIIHYTDFRY